MSADPYVVSSALRRRFREDKKIALEKQGRDDGLRDRYGLHDEVDLGVEDVELGKAMWEAGRERLGLPVDSGEAGPSTRGEAGLDSSVRATRGTPLTRNGKVKGRAESTTSTPDLASLLRKTTAKKYDPFSDSLDTLFSGSVTPTLPVRVKSRLKEAPIKNESPIVKTPDPPARSLGTGMAVLAGYESD
jgi:coiled-coil domain-containing protein 130